MRPLSMNAPLLFFIFLTVSPLTFASGKMAPALVKENYPFSPYSPLIARVKSAPDFVMDHLNHTIYLKGNCQPFTLNSADIRSIEKSFGNLPPLLWNAMREKVLGIYFVSGMRATGITETVYDRKGREFYIVYFNARVLKQDLSEMLTAKLNTAFIGNDGPTNISVDCGSDRDGFVKTTVMPGFLYILLHEAVHIAEFGGYLKKGIYRPVFAALTNGIWNSFNKMNRKVEPVFRKDITFYGNKNGPRISIAQAGLVLNELTNSPFVSPYAYLNENDDIAELLSFYFLTQRMYLPYRIVLRDGVNRTGVYKPMESEKVRARLPLVKTLFSENAN